MKVSSRDSSVRRRWNSSPSMPWWKDGQTKLDAKPKQIWSFRTLHPIITHCITVTLLRKWVVDNRLSSRSRLSYSDLLQRSNRSSKLWFLYWKRPRRLLWSRPLTVSWNPSGTLSLIDKPANSKILLARWFKGQGGELCDFRLGASSFDTITGGTMVVVYPDSGAGDNATIARLE